MFTAIERPAVRYVAMFYTGGQKQRIAIARAIIKVSFYTLNAVKFVLLSVHAAVGIRGIKVA